MVQKTGYVMCAALITMVGVVYCLDDSLIIPGEVGEVQREGLDYPVQEEDRRLHSPVKRGRYDYWRGFGSDGLAGLYDFVKRDSPSRRPSYKRNFQHYRDLTQDRNARYFRDPEPQVKKSRYNYWKGFGSDGYAGLYDFVKK